MLISLIIPVFNGEKYLSGCLDSIFSQNFTDFELIIVDDGSTDKTRAIINRYQLVYSNIKSITTNNYGPFEARRLGIQIASGKYIGFVDCDDILMPNYFSILSDATKSNNDVIVFNLIEEDCLSRQIELRSCVFPNIESYRRYVLDSKSNNLVSKIYKRTKCNIPKLINMPSKTEEDLLMQCYILDNCESILFINKPLYLYKYRNNSTTKSTPDFDKIENKFNPYSLSKLLFFDKKWNAGMHNKIILNKLYYLYDFFIPIVRRYHWKDYADKILCFDFVDLNILRFFDLSVIGKKRLFILRPLLYKKRFCLWIRTRFYILLTKIWRKK